VKRKILFFAKANALLFVFFLITTTAKAQGGGTDLLNLAMETKANITQRLQQCGMDVYNPRDPRLPFLQVPAHEAYANLSVPWLSGYFYRASGYNGQKFVFKRPNGASVAWFELSGDSRLAFYTAFGGIQAKMNKFYTVNGQAFNFQCQSTYVTAATFQQCVETFFVQPLLQAFCY
jgi:hypothetical protein